MESITKLGLLLPTHFSRPNSHFVISRPNSKLTTFTRATSGSVTQVVEDDKQENVLHIFFKERQETGDFISKASDFFWQRQVLNFLDSQPETILEPPPDLGQSHEATTKVSEYEGGFLKLTTTQEWISGDATAPLNKKAIAKAMRNDMERRKKLNFLQYEAIKRELLLLSVSIGTAVSGYCLVALSVQAAISYATGVLFSCLYLQLLYRHADNLSKETVPRVFMLKKSKKIGIRSEDLDNFFERTLKGSGIALSSPRLVIPAAIYGLWALSHQNFTNDLFDFQIVPAIFGMLVYKAAALVQVYRDNEDLQLILPDSISGGFSD